MGLVDYESTDDEDVEDSPADVPKNSLKRKRSSEPLPALPPLPSKFHDLYASTIRVSTRDDPSLHGGRKRVTPHVQGNWPTHLFIEWYPNIAEHGMLTSLISYIQHAAASEALGDKIESALTSDLDAPLPLHISLSRPIGFATDQKDLFLSTLIRNIERSSIRPFDVNFTKLAWVSNFDKSRWFLVLSLEKPVSDGLNKLLRQCNKTVVEFGQLPLYAELTAVDKDCSGSFHISIGWTLISPDLKLLRIAAEAVNLGAFAALRKMSVQVEEVKAKVGNIVASVKLPLKVTERAGLFG